MVISASTAMLIASLIGLGTQVASSINTGISNDQKDLTDSEAQDVLEDIQDLSNSEYAGIRDNPYWQSLSSAQKKALIREYNLGESAIAEWNVDYGSLLSDLKEYNNLEGLGLYEPVLSDYVDVNKSITDAETAIAAENALLLQSLNEDLQNTSDAYVQSRDALLTQQHQANAQTIDTMASEMSRARRNAIEAGASAGVRIAENVNTLLSAQNQISQRSLETSNQLAQMLVSQRNAESGLRNQWRDAQLSTYDRVQSRAANERSLGQARYDEAMHDYNTKVNNATSATNPLVDRMQRYRNASKYSANTGTTY